MGGVRGVGRCVAVERGREDRGDPRGWGVGSEERDRGEVRAVGLDECDEAEEVCALDDPRLVEGAVAGVWVAAVVSEARANPELGGGGNRGGGGGEGGGEEGGGGGGERGERGGVADLAEQVGGGVGEEALGALPIRRRR